MTDPDVMPHTPAALPPTWEVVRLARILRERLPVLRERYGVRSLELFGSYVHDEQRPDSDLDVLVEFERVPGLFTFIDLQDDLSALLGVQVDLVMKSALKPAIGRQILREAVAV